jgi:hypothetical protein
MVRPPAPDLWNITYRSREITAFTRSQLYRLLEQSRGKNARLEITGLLLYKGGHFLQAIEGPREAVERLYDSIEHDSRHEIIRLLASEAILRRRFPDWAMAFRDLNIDPKLATGFSGLLNQPWTPAISNYGASELRALIEIFD